MKTLFLSMLLTSLSYALISQIPGSPDTDFGDEGVVLLDHTESQNNIIKCVAIQNNGRLVFGGQAWGEDIFGFNFIRLLADGTADDSFGTNGIVLINQESETIPSVYGIAMQNDNKIVGIGGRTVFDHNKMCIIRLNPDGSPDNGFGDNGIVEVDLGLYISTNGFALEILDNGQILALGSYSDLPDWQLIICKLNTDGSFDQTFGGTGIVLYDVPDKLEWLNSIDIQNGKIIVGGNSFDENWNVFVTLCRFHLNGSIDSDFGIAGLVLRELPLQFDINDNWFGKVCLSPDDKIVYAGFADGNLDEDFVVCRFLENGAPDNSFGSEGMSITDIEGKAFAQAVVVQNDRKIIAGGYVKSDLGYDADFAMVRYLENGDPDPSFGTDGVVIQNISTTTPQYEDKIECLALQPDGKIIAAGFAYTDPPTFIDYAVVRYHGDAGYMIDDSDFEKRKISISPNPFTNQTTLEFTLEDKSNVSIDIYNNEGRNINTLASQSFDPGIHQLRWNTNGLATGMYIIKMRIGDKMYSTKLIKADK